MKSVIIYELAIIPTGALNTIRQKETMFSYFSNLKKTIESVTAALALHGWPDRINYSSVYRSLQSKGKYVREFDISGNKYFKIVITAKVMNPALSTLGIEEMPHIKPDKRERN